MSIIVYPTEKRQRPTTTVTIDGTALGMSASSSQKALVLIGSAKGGTPNTVYRLNSYTQAKNIFRGGELLDAIELSWNPSDEYTGASIIYAIRVDEADTAKSVQGPLLIESKLYGEDANAIVVTLSDNNLTKTKRLDVTDGVSNTSETFDNLGSIFYLKYTGEEAIAQVEIKDYRMTIKVGADVGTLATALSYDLGNPAFDRVSKLIADISLHEGFDASFTPFGDKDIKTAELDDVTALDIKTEELGGLFTSLIGDLMNQTEYSSLVSVSRNEATKEDPITNFVNVALSGGTNGKVPSTWHEAFKVLSSDDSPLAYYVVPLSPMTNIHAETASFIKQQRALGYPMRSFVGGGLQETFTQLVNRKNRLYQAEMALIGFNATVRLGDGRTPTIPGYMVASMVGGLASGLDLGEPITYKSLRMVGTTNNWSSDDLDQLHINGIIGVEKVRSRNNSSTYRVVSDVTTYNVEEDVVKSRIAIGEESDFLAIELREMLDRKFKGRRSSIANPDQFKVAIYTFLLQKKNRGDIVDFDADGIAVVIIGNRVQISAPVLPAQGLDYINATLIYQNEARTLS